MTKRFTVTLETIAGRDTVVYEGADAQEIRDRVRAALEKLSVYGHDKASVAQGFIRIVSVRHTPDAQLARSW